MRYLIGGLWLLAFSLSGFGVASAGYDPDCVVVYGSSGPVCVSRGDAGTKLGKVATRPKTGKTRVAAKPKIAPVFGTQGHVAQAQRWIGATAAQMGVRRTLWCAAGLNKWLRDAGLPGTNSDMARSFVNYGSRIHGTQVGAIAVSTRGKSNRSGHVAVVSRIEDGRPVFISANFNGRVAESRSMPGHIIAWRMPPGATYASN
jgi:uncharacterized protein (TIGR02594 family)